MTKKIILLSLGLSVLLFSSCINNEYYETTPDPQPVEYRYAFDDNFDVDANNWSFIDQRNAAYVEILKGLLKYSYLPGDDGTNTVAISTGAAVNRDFLIQTSIRSDYAMGIAFGVSNNDFGYSFFIDNEGYFSLYKEGDANTPVQTIIDWQQSNAISINGWNDVEFEQVGNYWIGFINGTKVFEVPARYLSGDQVGYIVLGGTTGYADYLTIQW